MSEMTKAAFDRRRLNRAGLGLLTAAALLMVVSSCSDLCVPCDTTAGGASVGVALKEPGDAGGAPSGQTAGDANIAFFAVDVEQGERVTTAGDRIAYCLFIPQADGAPVDPPYPAVVISHGFARGKQYHGNTACALAQRGIIVLTPNMVSLLGGEPAQLRNIENLADHVRWLRGRAADENDTLHGLLDPNRIGLAGHSAGGAISFEAAIDLAASGEAASALMLLDAVPWARTIDRAAELNAVDEFARVIAAGAGAKRSVGISKAVRESNRDAAETAFSRETGVTVFAGVRSEPSACNADAAVLELPAGLSFATTDLRVVGGSHCDPENPSDFFCGLTCGGSDEQARAAYQELLYAFMHDALAAPDVGAADGYAAVVSRLITEGRVVREKVGAAGE